MILSAEHAAQVFCDLAFRLDAGLDGFVIACASLDEILYECETIEQAREVAKEAIDEMIRRAEEA